MSTPEKSVPTLTDLQDLAPFANTIGLTVTAASHDGLTASWTVSDGLLQPYGLLHGGVHCSVIETLASMAAAFWLGVRRDRWSAPRTRPTSSEPAGPGIGSHRPLEPLHRGRSRQVWRVETVDDQGRLVAAGQVGIQNLHRLTPDRQLSGTLRTQVQPALQQPSGTSSAFSAKTR